MTAVRTLLHLEQLDNDLERLEGELRDARRRMARNPKLEAAEARLATLRRQEQEAGAQQRALEGELGDLAARIGKDQARMYSGQIVDPRELASLERELEHYRARQTELEDRCLALMETVETHQAEIESASRQVDELRAAQERDRGTLSGQSERLTADIKALRSQREKLTAEVDQRSLDLYTRLRASTGHAVSHAASGVCEWCHVSIPPKDVQHARGAALVQCTNCARILYVA